MKIAIIEPVGDHGGMHHYNSGLYHGLSKNLLPGDKVELYTCQTSQPASPSQKNIYPYFNRVWQYNNKYIKFLSMVYALLKSLLKARLGGASTVHYHLFHTTALELIFVYFAKILGFKIILTIHDINSFSGNDSAFVSKKIFSTANSVIVHNEFCKSAILEKNPEIKTTINVIKHGNYLSIISPETNKNFSRKKLDLEQDVPIILFFGQIKKIKGLDILLDATLKISTEFPEEKFKLVVAGRPWKIDKEYCKEKLKKLEESGKLVCRFGFIPDDELPHYLSAADLIVLPYRQVYQSGVLLLAMSLGCPVIASNIPGMAEIIKNDETGWLFRNEDFENLATTIQQALRSKEDRQKIALNARKCMEDQYSWADIGKETADVYRKISE